ncbi:MAG: hypothetical protein QF570_12715 [Myxococcota bacterium]|jgi:hypothetical protein|nr:hypothetical protein [Myxococcota bacterium]
MAVVVLFGMVACTSAQPLYPGGRRPPGQSATLKMVTNGAITNINGRELEGRHFELLPASYDVVFRIIVQGSEIHSVYEGRAVRWTFICDTRLSLEAGRDYEIARSRVRSPLSRTGVRQIAGKATHSAVDIALYLRSVDADGKVQSSTLIVCSEFEPEDGWEELD